MVILFLGVLHIYNITIVYQQSREQKRVGSQLAPVSPIVNLFLKAGATGRIPSFILSLNNEQSRHGSPNERCGYRAKVPGLIALDSLLPYVHNSNWVGATYSNLLHIMQMIYLNI